MRRNLFYSEFPRDQFWGLFYSKSFYMIYISLWMKLMLEAMQMITPYTIGKDIKNVVYKLKNSSKILFQWFMDNQMKANRDKCHFICSNTNDTVNLIVENQAIENSIWEKLFGVKFDYKLIFKAHINDVCKKAGLNLNDLSRIALYMKFNKKRLLVNEFLISQFIYSPLI